MKLRIQYRMSKKVVENLLQQPPIVRRRLYYLRFIGGALAHSIFQRVARYGIGSDGSPIDRFNNSGGMWKGFESQLTGSNRATLQFNRSSPSSASAKFLRGVSFKNKRDRNKYIRKLRDAGKFEKVRNRFKAFSAENSKSSRGRSLIDPTLDEITALTTWMGTHLEYNMFGTESPGFERQPSEFPEPDRFNLLLPKMPDPRKGN